MGASKNVIGTNSYGRIIPYSPCLFLLHGIFGQPLSDFTGMVDSANTPYEVSCIYFIYLAVFIYIRDNYLVA